MLSSKQLRMHRMNLQSPERLRQEVGAVRGCHLCEKHQDHATNNLGTSIAGRHLNWTLPGRAALALTKNVYSDQSITDYSQL